MSINTVSTIDGHRLKAGDYVYEVYKRGDKYEPILSQIGSSLENPNECWKWFGGCQTECDNLNNAAK
jgi:hypothetical protein